jgi:hypothetical protein
MGFILQTTDAKQLHRADLLLGNAAWEPPHTERSRVLTDTLRGMMPYREETNFAKIDRIDHPEIEAFKAEVLAMTYRGRTVTAWMQLLRDLASVNPTVQELALDAIRELYV